MIKLGAIVSAVLLILQLTGVISVGWFIIALPLLIGIGLTVVGVILALIVAAIANM